MLGKIPEAIFNYTSGKNVTTPTGDVVRWNGVGGSLEGDGTYVYYLRAGRESLAGLVASDSEQPPNDGSSTVILMKRVIN